MDTNSVNHLTTETQKRRSPTPKNMRSKNSHGYKKSARMQANLSRKHKIDKNRVMIKRLT